MICLGEQWWSLCIETITQALQGLQATQGLLNDTQQLYTDMKEDFAELIDSVSNSSSLLDEVTTLVTQTQQYATQANSTAREAETALNNRLALVDVVSSLHTRCQAELGTAQGNIMQLRQQLALAKTASAMVWIEYHIIIVYFV